VASPKTIRRSIKIWKQVRDALYPFEADLTVVFLPGGKIPRHAETGYWKAQKKITKGKSRKQGFKLMKGKSWKQGFFALTLRELPQATIRRFVYYCDSGPEPTEEEFQKFSRLLVGTARRKLMAEQVQRIKKLKHLPGRGRIGINDKERDEIRQEFHQLKQQLADAGESAPATIAARRVAEKHECKLRNVWKILSLRSRRGQKPE
jgi:hypothetical protein